jgi:hypothetical protein
LELRFSIVLEDSPDESAPANGQPIDKAYRSRTARILVPIWALLALGNLIWAIASSGAVVFASILFGSSFVGLVRLRWPQDTWPVWLFSYKP